MHQQIEQFLKMIIRDLSPDKIILFGSYARGDSAKESDYDFCILKKGILHKRRYTQKIYKMLFGLDKSIDIIVETPEKFEKLKQNPFLIYKKIAEEGKVLYEKSKINRRMV